MRSREEERPAGGGWVNKRRDLPDGPAVNGHVPGPPEGVDVVGVPPVAVKVAVREVQHFTHEVQVGVKGQVEKAQPHQVIWYL